jgi:hypothetical protein
MFVLDLQRRGYLILQPAAVCNVIMLVPGTTDVKLWAATRPRSSSWSHPISRAAMARWHGRGLASGPAEYVAFSACCLLSELGRWFLSGQGREGALSRDY